MIENLDINWTIVTIIVVAWVINGMIVRVENRLTDLIDMLGTHLDELEKRVESAGFQVQDATFELQSIHRAINGRDNHL